MSDEHRTLQAFGVIFTSWSVVFFGVWVLPVSDQTRILLDGITTAGFIMFGLSYFMYKRTIPTPKVETVVKASFWVRMVGFLVEVVSLFYVGVRSWVVTEINGVAVVTYSNLLSILFGGLGVVVVALTIWFARNANPYKRTISRKTKKPTAT